MEEINCSACNSNNIKFKDAVGRGLPPKGWKRKPGDNRLISWKGTWRTYTCNKCGNEWKKLL